MDARRRDQAEEAVQSKRKGIDRAPAAGWKIHLPFFLFGIWDLDFGRGRAVSRSTCESTSGEKGGDCGGRAKTERLPLPKPRGEIQHDSSANFPHSARVRFLPSPPRARAGAAGVVWCLRRLGRGARLPA